MGLSFEACNIFLGQLAWKWQVFKVQKNMENMDFTSLTGYNLNFSINFGQAATQFLADMPT